MKTPQQWISEVISPGFNLDAPLEVLIERVQRDAFESGRVTGHNESTEKKRLEELHGVTPLATKSDVEVQK